MKCIKQADGVVSRVKDEVALKSVNAGSAEYCTKSEWKTKTRGPVAATVKTVKDEDKKKKRGRWAMRRSVARPAT